MKKYKIARRELVGREIIEIAFQNKKTYCSLFLDYGGAMHEWVVDGQSILETAVDEDTFASVTQATFAGAQLCPFPNRIRDGKFTFEGNTYELDTNDPAGNNALHGLVFSQPFEVISTDEDTGSIQIGYVYDGKGKGYPFQFKLINTFQLLDKGLSVRTEIFNESDSAMPIGHGWHPYFSVGEKIDRAYLQIAAQTHHVIGKDYLPTGEEEDVNQFTTLSEIGNGTFNHCLTLEEGVDEMAKIHFPTKNLMLKLVTAGYPYLQIYVPPARKSIALEPQTSIPDAFNNGVGLITLSPEEHASFEMNMLLEETK